MDSKLPLRACTLALLLSSPFCLALSLPPASIFFNAALAVAVWGTVLIGAAGPQRPGQHGSHSWLAVVVGQSLVIALLVVGLLAKANELLIALCALGVALVATRPKGTVTAAALLGLLFAGLLSVGLALLQYVAPGWADGALVARPTVQGRAFANLRQPNQFGTLLLLASCTLPVLCTRSQWSRSPMAVVATSCLMLGVALSSSRTSVMGALLVYLWAVFDRSMPRSTRMALLCIPAVLGLWWTMLWGWGHWGNGPVYFAEARASSGSDISSSRFAIWSNTLDLIAAHPWAGVGWGNFNFAWTFTEFPDRPIAFFDHTHNIVLQFAVELGLPATLLILGVFFGLLWHARGALRHPDPNKALLARCCLMMLMLLGWHSMLEYPLWYPYFLFPAAFALGTYLGIGWPRTGEAGARAAPSRWSAAPFQVIGALMIVGAVYAVWDYQRVVQIYAPYGEQGRQPLAERIRIGQRSTFFRHHADYAAVTTAERPSQVFDAFERPLRHLVDARLMVAYARALDELGERDRAVYVAQRLREFRHPLGDEFFKVCDTAAEPMPFQCDRVPRKFDYRELYPSAIRRPAR